MSAAVARRVLPLVDAFHAGTPGCRVTIRETALDDLHGPLRRVEVDLSILPLPVAEPDLAVGPCCPKPRCSPSPPTTVWPDAAK
ncbi:hypothetical protein STENM327S_07812 [Streptomyces tendae]